MFQCNSSIRLVINNKNRIKMYWFIIIELFLIHKSMECTIPTFENLTVQSNFSVDNFLGTWYEIKGLSNNETDRWHDYSQLFELENNTNDRLIVFGRARLHNEEKCFSFGPWLIITNDSAKMILTTMNISNEINLDWPYFILRTDYNHYALIYGCMSENYTHSEQCTEPILWVFSRTQSLSNEYLNDLDNYIENVLCLNLTRFKMTFHSKKPCYALSSLGTKIYPVDILIFLILCLFLIYK